MQVGESEKKNGRLLKNFENFQTSIEKKTCEYDHEKEKEKACLFE